MTYHDDARNDLARDLIALIDADARGEIHLPRTVAERVLEEAVIEAAEAFALVARTEQLPSCRQMDEQWAAMSHMDSTLAALTAYRDNMKNEHAASDCPAPPAT